MGLYLLKRIGLTIIVMFIVSTIAFFLMLFIPGDPVYAMLGDQISMEEYDMAYHQLGLDKPVGERYLTWINGLLHGDLGTSLKSHVPVWDLIIQRLPVTMYLAGISILISFPVGVLFGMITAVYRGKKIDSVITLLANFTACLPQFWIGITLMYFFALKTGLLPSFGLVWPPWKNPVLHMRQLIMPAVCLSLGGIAAITRQTRSSMLEVINQDYIRTARSKGLRERKVIFVHVMKNGLIPIITMLGNRLAFLVGASMFVESVFSIPGMGLLVVKSIAGRDIPVVQACVLVTALITGIAFIVTDILYVIVDPRISLTESE